MVMRRGTLSAEGARRRLMFLQVRFASAAATAPHAPQPAPSVDGRFAPFHSRYGTFGTFDFSHAETFIRDGIVCVPNFVPPAYTDHLRESLGRIVDAEAARREREQSSSPTTAFTADAGGEKAYLSDSYFLESGDKIRFFLEPNQTKVSLSTLNKVGHALHTDGGAFQEFTSQQCFRSIARRLGVQQPSVVQSMYILKAPKIGTAVGAHQDSTWIHTRPFSCIAMWTALDDCTVHNSCLLALKGSHRTHIPLGAKAALVDGKSVLSGTLPDVPLEKMEPLECPRGSLVIFNGQLVHGSTGNLSDKRRHAYVFHMVDDAAVWSNENWFGTHLARLAL